MKIKTYDFKINNKRIKIVTRRGKNFAMRRAVFKYLRNSGIQIYKNKELTISVTLLGEE